MVNLTFSVEEAIVFPSSSSIWNRTLVVPTSSAPMYLIFLWQQFKFTSHSNRQRLFQYTWPRNEYRPQYRACSHEDTRHTGAYRMWITCLKEERSTTHAQTATLSVLRSRRRRLTLEIGSSILQIGSHLDWKVSNTSLTSTWKKAILFI